jgi:serine protease Do
MTNRSPRMKLIAGGALALALATTALTPVFHADAQPAAPAATAPATAVALPRAAMGPDFADLVARVAPSVVRVTVTGHAEAATPAEMPPELRGSPFERFFRGMPGQQGQGREGMPQGRRTAGQGSGFIIDGAGYIVTNNHVVGRADAVKVELADGRTLPAKVVGSDPQTDVALLKVEPGATPLQAVTFGDSDTVRVGEWVLAMGNPFGLGGTATTGIVSARGRQIGTGPYDDFLQTDAAVNPGNSGGPLFNTAGEVVGINTAIFSPSGASAGIGFAVPARLATQVVAQLKEHGRVERGWLGVSMQPMDEELGRAVQVADGKGALIAQVEPESPAAKGGLKAGDVVVGVNGQAIASPRDLAMAMAAMKPGQTATVAVMRDGSRAEERITVGTVPGTRMAAQGQQGEAGTGALGLALAPAGKGEGAVVAQVRPDSVAAERGLKAGDVILRAGGRQVKAPQDVQAAVKAAQEAGRNAIALQIQRDGGSRFMALPLTQG